MTAGAIKWMWLRLHILIVVDGQYADALRERLVEFLHHFAHLGFLIDANFADRVCSGSRRNLFFFFSYLIFARSQTFAYSAQRTGEADYEI